MPDVTDVVRAFVDAYAAKDHDRMRALVADGIDAHITSAAGGVDDVRGADAFLARFPDLDDAELTLTVTQAVAVEPDRVLALVRVEARRGDATLHNVGGFLVRVAEGRMADFWMVDALPAESAEFWSRQL
jgi:hypothetical protein